MNIEPYLFFEGRCEEAVEFYRKALDAKVVIMVRYKDSPDPPPPGMIPPGSEDKIMHVGFLLGDTMVMASDGMCSGKMSFDGFSLSINIAEESDADKYFNALAEEGTVQMPLGKTFWSPRFGMVKDKFGVAWMIHVVAKNDS